MNNSTLSNPIVQDLDSQIQVLRDGIEDTFRLINDLKARVAYFESMMDDNYANLDSLKRARAYELQRMRDIKHQPVTDTYLHTVQSNEVYDDQDHADSIPYVKQTTPYNPAR